MHQINPDLLPLAVDIATLTVLANNPRKGDIEAVKKSYEMFGQRKPIVVRRADNVVLAGNHQLLAARELDWDKIAVVMVDDDENTATAFVLADNRTSDLGTYDDELLAALLASIADDDALLLASGYFDERFTSLHELPLLPGGDDAETTSATRTLGIIIECETEDHQVELLNLFIEQGLNVRALS